MGYEEILKPIDHLAEAAGIRDVINEYADNCEIPGQCQYYCAVKQIKDPNGRKSTGGSSRRLFACFGGDRCVMDSIGGYHIDEMSTDPSWNYHEFFEDLDESLVDEAAAERPDLVSKARENTVKPFERMIGETREWHSNLRKQSDLYLQDVIALLTANGPTSYRGFCEADAFKKCDILNILTELSNEGFIDADYSKRPTMYSLSDK